jgi:hypothetical protein
MPQRIRRWASGCAAGEVEWENLQTQAEPLLDQLQDTLDDDAVAAILDEAQRQAATVQASVATVNTATCTTGTATATSG